MGLYRDNGKENGTYYLAKVGGHIWLYADNGKENGNYRDYISRSLGTRCLQQLGRDSATNNAESNEKEDRTPKGKGGSHVGSYDLKHQFSNKWSLPGVSSLLGDYERLRGFFLDSS